MNARSTFLWLSLAAMVAAWVALPAPAPQAQPPADPPAALRAQAPAGSRVEPSASPAAGTTAGAVAEPAAGGEPGFYLGVGTCLGAGCHGATRPREGDAVLGNEYYTWLREDPHQGAFNTLFDDRSLLIARHLGVGEPHRAALCLDCHATHVPAERKRGALALEDGVSCESCHGAASGWRDAHTEPGWTHERSVARGLVDLRRPAVRAAVCLGCHLGDASRTVDHALLAAGHPQLPFELDNYSRSMPPHWIPARTPGFSAWAVGQVAAFGAGMEQLARRARGPHWPEFAELSCRACHHSLADGAWRQQRGYAERVRPGQPPWSPARWAALRHLVAAVAPGEVATLDAEVAALGQAVERLGQPAEVVERADALAARMAGLLPAVTAAEWDPARARRLIAALAADRERLLASEVETAEQVFFAVQSLTGELIAADPALLGGPLPTHLDRLYRALEDPEGYDPRHFADLLAALAETVPSP